MSTDSRQQLMQLNRLYKEGSDFYYETAAKIGLSSSELMLLYGLCHIKRPCTQTELCERWYLKKQTLHSALKKLIKADIVYMTSLPEKPKQKLITLTEKGQKLCEETAIPFVQSEQKAFDRLTAQEREMLLSLTQKHQYYIKEEAEKLLENINV